MQANTTRSPSADGARNNKTENVRHQTCSPCGPSGSPFRWKAAEVVTGEDSSGSASETRVDPIGVSGDGLEPVHHLLTFFSPFSPHRQPSHQTFLRTGIVVWRWTWLACNSHGTFFDKTSALIFPWMAEGMPSQGTPRALPTSLPCD